MNEVVNTFLLAGENFMPKLHLRQPGLIYSVWGLSEERKKLYGPFFMDRIQLSLG